MGKAIYTVAKGPRREFFGRQVTEWQILQDGKPFSWYDKKVAAVRMAKALNKVG